MRLVIPALVLGLLVACGGRNGVEWQRWERQILQLELVGQVAYTQLVDSDWIETGRLRDGQVVETKECKKGGGATLYDDGSIVFEDCKSPNGNLIGGGLIQTDGDDTTPQQFIYDEFTIIDDQGVTHVLDGGYTTTDTANGTHCEADIVMVAPGGDGEEETTLMQGSFDFVGEETVNGQITIETLGPWGNHTTTCAYEGMPIEEFIELMRGDPDVPELNCPPTWDKDVKIVVRTIHEHDGDENNIHIAFEDEFIGDVPHVRPGGKKRRSHKTTLGARVVMQVGRGGTVWSTATCPAARNGQVYDAVYDDGLGLNSYEFYCTIQGNDPFYGINEPGE